MTTAPDSAETSPAPDLPRSRDAGRTRGRLLEAGRLRFARDGYSSTTVRDIAGDVGVNVSLINRYFTSKEGLFEACLDRTVEELDAPGSAEHSLEALLGELVRQVAEPPGSEQPLRLLLLLRSSGDDQADAIRRATLRTYAERMAAIAGWRPGVLDDGQLLLRAEMTIAAVLGMVVLRTSTGVEPLASAGEADLAGPLGAVVSALLDPGRPQS